MRLEYYDEDTMKMSILFEKKSQTISVLTVLFILTFIFYANALPNEFFADDYHQIVDNPAVHSITNIPHYFLGSTFYRGGVELVGNYYKPFLTSFYAIMYSVFGNNPFGFHFVQLILHILNGFFVFLLAKKFFPSVSSFFIAIFFLLHPINNEAVVYIANLQDVLFMFFGLSALLISSKQTFGKYFFVGILLLLSLLSKESGILFLAILPLFAFIQYKSWRKELVISILVFAIYCCFRFLLAKVYFNQLILAPIMSLSLGERLLHIPFIIFSYLKTFFFPIHLIMFQNSIFKAPDLYNFYLPLFVVIIFFLSVIYIGIKTFHNKKLFPKYIFFVVWFLIGLLLHIQVFPLDGTVAERWFYFPSIGLLGIIVLVIQLIKEQFHLSNEQQKFIVFGLIILVIIFGLRILERNTNWRTQKTLLAHDVLLNPSSYQLHEGLGLELMKEKKLDEAYPHLLRSTELFPGVHNLNSLGVYYANTKQMDKAEDAFKRAMQYDTYLLTYENYGLLLFLRKDYAAVIEFGKDALVKFPNSHRLWLYQAVSLYQLSRYEEALVAAKNAYALDSSSRKEYVLKSIENKQQLDMEVFN